MDDYSKKFMMVLDSLPYGVIINLIILVACDIRTGAKSFPSHPYVTYLLVSIFIGHIVFNSRIFKMTILPANQIRGSLAFGVFTNIIILTFVDAGFRFGFFSEESTTQDPYLLLLAISLTIGCLISRYIMKKV